MAQTDNQNSDNKTFDFLNLVLKRQSNRAYLDKQVEEDKLLRCLEAARLAPSACNSQPWTFIVINEKELKNKIADTTSNRLLPLNHFTKQAPVHIVIVQESANITSTIGGAIQDKNYPLIDIGIAAEHLCLQAAAENLGSCMIGWFNEKKVKSLLDIPANKRPLLIITLGYPSDLLRKKKRKNKEKIIRYNNYHQSNSNASE